jgi:gluconokinase
MPPSLLRSQIDTLEALEPDEIGVTIDVAPAPEQIARAAVEWLEKPRT